MKSYDEVIDIIHEFKPNLANELCRLIISFLCPDCPGPPCSKCGIGNKYLYYDYYKNSISIIHKWISEKCFMKKKCLHTTMGIQIYDVYTHIWCNKRVLKIVHAKYGIHVCCKHKHLYIKNKKLNNIKI